MFTPENSVLIVIDVQGDLAHRMFEKKNLFFNVGNLIQSAQLLDLPILWTEQAPEKIGETVKEVARYLQDYHSIRKTSFSCYESGDFKSQLHHLDRKNIIICGIEAHVCIYQTADDLISCGYQVQIVADAVSSRSMENKEIALEKLKSIGCSLTSTEMIAMELLRTADHPKFREFLKLIK